MRRNISTNVKFCVASFCQRFVFFTAGPFGVRWGGVKVKQAPRNTFPKFIYHSNTRKIHVDEIEGEREKERERGANWAAATFLKKL